MDEKIPIVAIGASAGGFEAIIKFFKNVPENIGAAFVIIRHLKKDVKSLQTDLLQPHTFLPVNEIKQGQKIEIDNIYMLPAGNKLELRDGHFFLYKRPENEIINTAIDDFFFSLAQEAGDKAIGVILSGLGSDGTNGAFAVEQQGGIIMVQNPEEAQFDGMPKNVIYFDHPDYVLTLKDMPQYIKQHLCDPNTSRVRANRKHI